MDIGSPSLLSVSDGYRAIKTRRTISAETRRSKISAGFFKWPAGAAFLDVLSQISGQASYVLGAAASNALDAVVVLFCPEVIFLAGWPGLNFVPVVAVGLDRALDLAGWNLWWLARK